MPSTKSTWIQERVRALATFARRIRFPHQVAFSAVLYAGVCGYEYGRWRGGGALDLRATIGLLGSIGAVVALLASISFAYLVFFFNHANSRRHDLYFRFKAMLFEFDKFLRDYSEDDPLIDSAAALSWELKGVRFDDVPFTNWEKRIAQVVAEIEQRDQTPTAKLVEKDSHLIQRILGYLGYLEDVLGEIGLSAIQLVVAKVHVDLVVRALALLGLLLAVVTVAHVAPFPILVPALYATPVFFTSLVLFLLVQVSRTLYRESEEGLTFVDRSDDGDGEDGNR